MLTITGTLFYRAPEMFSGGGYDEKVDIWAIGILMYWMITRKTPFESPYLSDTIQKIKDHPPCFSEEIWKLTGKGLKNLIKRMLQKDKSTRLTPT